jgi:hypothetical protein
LLVIFCATTIAAAATTIAAAATMIAAAATMIRRRPHSQMGDRLMVGCLVVTGREWVRKTRLGDRVEHVQLGVANARPARS